MSGNREGQTHIHSAGVALHWCIQEPLDVSESHDFVKFSTNLHALHSQDGSVEVDVISTGQFGMKTCPYFQQTSYSAMDLSPAGGRLNNTRKNLEQGAFPCPVTSNDPNDFAAFYFKRHILQSPESIRVRISSYKLRSRGMTNELGNFRSDTRNCIAKDLVARTG